MRQLSRTDQTLKEYQRYTEVFRELNHKILDAYFDETTLEKAMRMLRLGKNRILILDSEDDLSVLMDFALYEVRQRDGKNSIERYAEEKGGANAIEKELLAAMVKAKIGLFKVNQFLREERQIVLENLITPEAPVILTDIHFSQTMRDKLLVFFRPVRTTKVTMTSGVAFAFPVELEQELTAHWRRLERKGSAELYAWFFRKSKQSGFEMVYM